MAESYSLGEVGQEDGQSEVVLEKVKGHTRQVRFDTMEWAQCRNEPPFLAVIVMRPTPRGIEPTIDCPHCLRGYRFVNGEWIADRPLIFLSPEEADEARKTCAG